MFCFQCGAKNEDAARFCENCGADLYAHAAAAQPQVWRPRAAQAEPPAPVPPAKRPAAIVPAQTAPIPPVPPVVTAQTTYIPVPPVQQVVVQRVRPAPVKLVPAAPTAYTRALTQNGASPLFLAATILLTLTSLLSLYTYFNNPSGSGMYFLLSAAGLWNRHSSGEGATLIAVCRALSFLPTLLCCIGLWAAFGACHSKNAQISTGGLSCIRAATVLKIVFTSIAFFFLLILAILALSANGGNLRTLWLLMGGTLSFVLYILLQASVMIALHSASEAAVDGRTNGNAPMFVAVVSILSAVLSLAAVVLSFFPNVLSYHPEDLSFWFRIFLGSNLSLTAGVIKFLTLLLSACGSLLFAVVVIFYRRDINQAAQQA